MREKLSIPALILIGTLIVSAGILIFRGNHESGNVLGASTNCSDVVMQNLSRQDSDLQVQLSASYLKMKNTSDSEIIKEEQSKIDTYLILLSDLDTQTSNCKFPI